MIMTNAEAFHYDFGIFATELWSMQEDEFLEWLNKECNRERPKDMIVRCEDCRYANECSKSVQYTRHEPNTVTIGYSPIEWCSRSNRRSE